MLQIKSGKCQLTKCKSIECRILVMWLLTSIALTIAKFFMVRLNIVGTARMSILWMLTFVPVICLFSIIKSIPQRKYLFFLFIFTLSVLSFGFTALINDKIGYFFVRKDYGIERVLRPDSAIYALLFFCLVDNSDDLLEAIREYSYIDFIGLLIFDYLPACLQGGWEDISYSGATVLYHYNLSFGYSMAFPTVVFIYLFIKEQKAYNLLLGVLGLFLIFTNGSRGALLIPTAFVGLMIISNIIDSRHYSWKIIKIGAITIVVLAIAFLGESILSAMVSTLENMGIQSRTLELLSSGKIASDSGRSEIWQVVIQAIKDGGLFGYGAFGDRPFVFPLHFVGYSHNIFLEMICSFGIIGVIICLAIVVGSVWMILFCKDTLTRELFIIFFSVSLQLCLSFSFWYVWEFWAMIAIAYNYFRDNMPVFLKIGNSQMELKKCD